MKRRIWAAALAAGLGTLPCVHAFGQLASFPGAQGFGGDATGGRGGSIYVVTNYNASGPGSFAYGAAKSNQIIVFAVGGYVTMPAAISCGSNLTILGQTAPGQGIAFEGHEISFSESSNCVIQYLRAREGSTDTSAKASINLGDCNDMILDHVDAEFSQYDNIDAVGANSAADNITLQNSLIADGIKAQQFNMHTEGTNTTYLNNIFANSEGRSVLSKANAQFVNNTIYDYGYAFTTGNSGGVFSYDIVNNDFIPGPSTNQKADAFYQLDTNQSAYSSGNLVAGVLTAATTGSSDTMKTLTTEWSPTTALLPTLSTTASLAFNLAHAGALYPNGDGTFGRDQVDALIVGQVSNGSGSILNEQSDDGLTNNGFGTLPYANNSGGTLDTVPFSWLMSHGLSTTSDAQLTLPNALGYDMIEEYAQQIGDQYAKQTATGGDWTTTTWSATTPGIYDHALIRGNGTSNGIITLSGTDSATAFDVSIGGNGPASGEMLSVSGGSLIVQDTIYVGDQNNATLAISGGLVQCANVQLGNTVWSADGTSSTTYTGSLNLTGGILATGQIVQGGGVAGSWTTGGFVNISGGTIQALGNLSISAPMTIGTGGATINTAGSTAVVSSVISGPGALNKTGVGVLTLSGTNTFSGGTNINAGEVGISTDANIAGSTSVINFNGGLLQVNGTTLKNINSHVVNWSTFNGGFDIATSTNTFTVSQSIGGGGSLTKTGAGTLVLSGSSTFTGGVILNAGVLSVSADPNLGANGNPLTFNSGTFQVIGTTLTNTNNHPLGTFGGGTFDINTAANTFTISQQVNGSGTLTKIGPGTLVLGTRDYFTGDTYLNAGTLRVGDPLSLRYTTVHLTTAGTTLDLNGLSETIGGLTGNQPFNINGANPLVGNNNTAQTYSGVISDSTGTGSITKIGTGVWSLTGANTFTDPLKISTGSIDIVTMNNGGTPGPLGAGTNAASSLVLDGGTLAFNGSAGASTDHLFTLTTNGGTLNGSGASGDGMGFTNTGAIAFTGTGARTLTLTGSETHNSFSPALADPDATDKTTLVMNGTGRWLWESKLSTYSGDTSIVAGTLELYTGGFLPSGLGKGNVDVNAGGTLTTTASTTINGLSNGSNGSAGTVAINTGTLTIGNGDASAAFGGVISGLALTKIGAGTQILGGINTYTGSTLISGGVLQFNLATSIGGTGQSVTLSNGAAAAAGYAINQAFLARLTNPSNGSAALAAASANNLDFSSATGANLPNVSLGAVGNQSYTGVLTPFGTNYKLGGGGGTLTLPNANELVGSNSVIISGPGIVSPTGLNTYTGTTTVLTGGTFSPAVAIGGASSGMGASTAAAANLILDGGTFEGIGTTDRAFTLTTNGGILDNSNGLNFNGSGSIVLPAAASVTLTLTGASTAHNLMNLGLTDASGGQPTSVVKTGNGKWTFSSDGTKTYSGPTHIMAGQLEALSGDAFSHYSDLVIDSTGSLEMHGENVTVNGLQGSGAIYDSFINGTRTLTIGAQNDGGTWAGNINSAATLNVVKTGSGLETFSAANTYVGSTNVTGGTLTLASTGSLISTAVGVSSGATFNLNGVLPSNASLTVAGTANVGARGASGIYPLTLGSINVDGGNLVLANSATHATRTVLITSSLNLAISFGQWQGLVDLGTNDADVQNGNLAILTSQTGSGFNSGGAGWMGTTGITSSVAAADSTHLTALAVVQNSVDGTPTGAPLYSSTSPLGLFDGISPSATDVLIKYTYFGDTNLDGRVDGSDYSRIDSGFISQSTGWYNGDFNYDGVVNGSDYTLIDNAFNSQGAALTSSIAAQLGSSSAVPEPAALSLICVAGAGLLGRRRR